MKPSLDIRVLHNLQSHFIVQDLNSFLNASWQCQDRSISNWYQKLSSKSICSSILSQNSCVFIPVRNLYHFVFQHVEAAVVEVEEGDAVEEPEAVAEEENQIEAMTEKKMPKLIVKLSIFDFFLPTCSDESVLHK